MIRSIQPTLIGIITKLVFLLGWLLPILAVFAHVGDGLWSIYAYDSKSKTQRNYAGLVSTMLVLFYYLHYDVQFSKERRVPYIIYQFIIFVGIIAGDFAYVCYYKYFKHDNVLMGFFIGYIIIDASFVFGVGYLKFNEYNTSMNMTTEGLLHLLAELEIIVIIYIPIFTAYEAMTTNCIAFFMIYRRFASSYHQQKSRYPRFSNVCFWFLIIFATASVVCESFDFVYDGYANNAHDPHQEEHYEEIARRWRYASNAAEIAAAVFCYLLIGLQFLKKEDKTLITGGYDVL